jgi:hypothetical protein
MGPGIIAGVRVARGESDRDNVKVEGGEVKKKAVDFDTVRKVAATIPGVEDCMTYGQPAFKVNGKLLACIPSHRSAEPNSLALRMDPEDLAELIAAAPEVYYAPEHYLDYPMVLVRLPLVDEGVLRDLLGMAHRYVVSHPQHKRTAQKRSPQRTTGRKRGA